MTGRLITPTVCLLLGFGIGAGSSWGDAPVVQLPLIRYEGKGQGTVTLPPIIYKGPAQMNQQAPQAKVVPNLVLKPQDAAGAFSTTSRVSLKVVCSREPESERLQYEFQRKVNRQWRSHGDPRWLGPAFRQGPGRLTITRYARFTRAGHYRWRCRAGQKGDWSAWTSELVVTAPGASTDAPPARRADPSDRSTPARVAD